MGFIAGRGFLIPERTIRPAKQGWSARKSALLSLALMASTTVLHGAEFTFDDADFDNGEEINEVCAGCHGEYGEGGKEGEYPRLAGLPAAFIAGQLHLFRERNRPNMAMIEYVDHRQMPDPDIIDVSAYLAAIELPSRLPPADESAPDFDAYQRLLDSERMVQIPRAEGDVEAGRKLYRRECGSCHGSEGQGDAEEAVPMLAGQYTNYLWRQVDKYIAKLRIHDPAAPDDELLAEFSKEELRDIFAHLSIADD
ncbi:MAG: c-type cytochrome [Pseudomonadota bacterium]|nr:c-type cytochrome [Pseudomonadota bacterium]